MFERFTEEARQVVVLAQDESRALRHPWIGTDHLLLGVLREDGAAAQALATAGLTLDRASNAVRQIVGEGDGPHITGQIPFTVEARKALERASQESIPRSEGTIDPALVLLGVLAVGSGTAACILADCEIDTDVVVAAIDDTIDPAPYRQAADAEPERSLPPSSSSSVEAAATTYFGLRRVMSVRERLGEHMVVVSVETYDNEVVVRWIDNRGQPADSTDWLKRELSLEDDVGTTYEPRGGGARANGLLRGESEFSPAPPAAASFLRVTDADGATRTLDLRT